MVALVHQGDKVQPARAGDHLDPQTRVSRTADHGLCHRGVRGFIAFKTRNVLACEPFLRQQVFQQHAGATAQGAVGKAGTGAGDVREGLQAEWIALGNDQPLRAPRKADDFVQARLQQRFVGACSQ